MTARFIRYGKVEEGRIEWLVPMEEESTLVSDARSFGVRACAAASLHGVAPLHVAEEKAAAAVRAARA